MAFLLRLHRGCPMAKSNRSLGPCQQSRTQAPHLLGAVVVSPSPGAEGSMCAQSRRPHRQASHSATHCITLELNLTTLFPLRMTRQGHPTLHVVMPHPQGIRCLVCRGLLLGQRRSLGIPGFCRGILLALRQNREHRRSAQGVRCSAPCPNQVSYAATTSIRASSSIAFL